MSISDWIPDASRMQMRQLEDGVEITFDAPAGGRQCGTCQLCCKLLPVPPIRKPANQRCQFQRFHKGCSVYARRPEPCRLFSCRWLIDPDAAGLRRPDRTGYVIDPAMDTIYVLDNASGLKTPISVIQIWCDPARPDAHRDAALRGYLDRMATEHGVAALVRFDSSRALTLFAPAFDSNRPGEWHERMSINESALAA